MGKVSAVSLCSNSPREDEWSPDDQRAGQDQFYVGIYKTDPRLALFYSCLKPRQRERTWPGRPQPIINHCW